MRSVSQRYLPVLFSLASPALIFHCILETFYMRMGFIIENDNTSPPLLSHSPKYEKSKSTATLHKWKMQDVLIISSQISTFCFTFSPHHQRKTGLEPPGFHGFKWSGQYTKRIGDNRSCVQKLSCFWRPDKYKNEGFFVYMVYPS